VSRRALNASYAVRYRASEPSPRSSNGRAAVRNQQAGGSNPPLGCMRAQHGGRASPSEGEGCWFNSSRALYDDVAKWKCGGLQSPYESVRFGPSSSTWIVPAERSASGLENRGAPQGEGSTPTLSAMVS
jgi:hypothetical protein